MNDLFKEPTKKAFDFASETTKQLITLSTGIVALTITFAKDILLLVPPSAKILLAIAWAIYVLSLLFGLLTLMALTSELQPKKAEEVITSPPQALEPPSIWAPSITTASIGQIATFLIATVLVVISGVVSALNNLNSPAKPTSVTSQAVRNQQRDLVDALSQKNVEALTRICGDDYLFTDESGEVINKRQLISSMQSGTLNYEHFSTLNTNVRLFDSTALVDGDATIKGTYKDRQINGRYRFITVFANREEQLQAISFQLSPFPMPSNQVTQEKAAQEKAAQEKSNQKTYRGRKR